MGLLITLILGLFIVVGALIVFLTNNNNKFITFSISLAFSVMFMLLVVDLLPEAYEVLSVNYNNLSVCIIILICILIGLTLLKLLDLFIPDHDDDLTTTKDDNDNLKHIGLISSIALVLHNIIEGMAIYGITTTSLKAGLLVSIGVGLHNIPLGMIITSTIYKSKKNKTNTILMILGISLSTFIGGLIMFLVGSYITDLLLGIFLGITAGMLVYIVFFELLPKIIHTKYKNITLLGIVFGILLLLVASLF